MNIGAVLERKESLVVKVKKMHVLVHPGYEYGDDNEKSYSRNVEEANDLFEKYKKIARQMPGDEIMVILVHHKPVNFKQHHKEGKTYVKNISLIDREVSNPRQVMVLTSENVPWSGAEKESDVVALEKVQSLAKKRGYEVNADTEVEVFGEWEEECVMEAFHGIKNTDFFKKVEVRKLKNRW